MKSTKKSALRKLLYLLKSHTGKIVAILMLSIFCVAGSLALPILFGKTIDLLIEAFAVNFSEVNRNLIVIAVVIFLTAISQYVFNLLKNKITFKLIKTLRDDIFKKIQQVPIKYIDQQGVSKILERNINDVEQIADGFLLGFSQLFSGILTIIGTLAIMFTINWIIALIVLCLSPISLFVAKFLAKKSFKLFKQTANIRDCQTGFINENISNLKIIKSFNQEQNKLKNFDEINEVFSKVSLQSIFISSLTNPVTRFINALIYACVVLAGAIMLISKTTLPFGFTVGLLTNLLMYATQYTKPFNEISEVITEFQNSLVCANRVFELLQSPNQIEDSKKAKKIDAKGDIVLNSVVFGYNKDNKIIKDFSTQIKSGQHIAIVGPTGCGKTTIINLLMRFYEIDDGKIEIDNINLFDITRTSLRQNFGMVLQETWLKKGTIKSNIAMGKPNASQEEIVEVAKKAYAHNFIMQLKDGYDTVIEEDGGILSEGQKQLLCIARVMLTKPPMLILDEATSAIDILTEQKVQKAFDTLMKGRTTFIIAHRLSTIKNADKILVLKDGKIIEQGSHKQLLETKGFYYDLYSKQLKG